MSGDRPEDRASLRWEQLRWIEIDAGTCGFGDAQAIGEDPLELLESPDRPLVYDLTGAGVPFVACGTQEDKPLPVEVLRGTDGVIVAARLEFVDDLATVPGRWQEAGSLVIGSGRCIAADPVYHSLPVYRVEFEIAPGRFIAEAFEANGFDILGLRIRREDIPASAIPFGPARTVGD